MKAKIGWHGHKGKMSPIVPWYVPPRKSRYEIEEVPVQQPYHAVRTRPQRQSLKLSFWERTVPPHLLGGRSGTISSSIHLVVDIRPRIFPSRTRNSRGGIDLLISPHDLWSETSISAWQSLTCDAASCRSNL